MRVLVKRGSGAGALWAVGKRLRLDEDEAHHLQVRRARNGDGVEVLDGAGLLGTGTLVQVGREWLVDVGAAEVQPSPAPLTLAVAAGDRERFSWLVEKSVELGVTKIVPLRTGRTAGVATRLKETHIERLRRSALESIKQCGASWAVAVEDPVPLAEFLGQPIQGLGWLADAEGAPPPASLAQDGVTVIIGPEGGLTEAERDAVSAAGYRPVALAVHTLRFETAALATAAAVTQSRMREQHG